jgi:hypothetical protein
MIFLFFDDKIRSSYFKIRRYFMNINRQLLESASLNPTKNSRQDYIFTLCANIEKNELTLPLYQRDVSWTLHKCIELLNYQLLSKSPISAISINVINNTSKDFAVPQVSFIERKILPNIVRGQMSVVDGQQRLTTNYKAYSDHPDLKNVVLDLGKGEFIEISQELRKNQIPVGVLLNKDDEKLITYTANHKALSSPSVVNALLQIRNKIKTYQYTINFATDLSEDEQINWFEVLNNAGSRVSIIQMRFSKLKAHGVDVYTQYTHLYKDKVSEHGYDYFDTPQKASVSYPIAALNPAYEVLITGRHSNNCAPISSDTKENQLCNLDPLKLKQCFDLTLSALDKTLEFIEENHLTKFNRSDYVNYLVGYFVFHKDGKITNVQKEALINWYNTVNFTNKSNTERRKIYSDLLKI